MTSPRFECVPRSLHRSLQTHVLALLCAWMALLPLQTMAADNANIDTLGKPRSGARATVAPLADPTRPPNFALPGAAAASAARAAAPAGAKAATPDEPAAAPAVLQAVQVPVRGPATAVVDGRLVQAGDTVDGHIVLAIDNQGLVLHTPRGNERLWLLSGTPKQAPGSIQITRTVSYVPAPTPAEPAPSSIASPPDAARPNPSTAKAAPQRNLSLAGSN